jgi:elongation factor G
MREYKAEEKRIVGFFGHHGCGKTTLMDDILVNYDSADRIGQRYLDKDPVEKEKGATFSNHIFSIDLDNTRTYFFDTPGSLDFIGDIQIALNTVDNVVIVINASSGIEVTTERIWNMTRDFNKPVMIFINQMDKEEANYESLIQELKETFEDGIRVVPFQVPMGKGSNFKGTVNLLSKETFIYEGNTGKAIKQSELPEESKELFETYRSELIEDIVENNEELMEKYFESGEEGLTQEELVSALHKAYDEDKIIPVFIGSATKNIGIDQLLEAIEKFGMTTSERKFFTENDEEISPSQDDSFLGLFVKNEVDPFVGKLTYLRVLRGSLKAGSTIYVVEENSREKISHLTIPRFEKNEEIEQAGVGDILVIPKLKSGKINQTVSGEESNIKLKLPEFPEPMISKSISPKSKNEIDKITESLAKIADSDPTFKWEFDPEIGETVISGMGSIHLEIMVEKLKKNFGIDFEVGKPKIAYKETIRSKSQAEYKHKKQTGGHGQYGHVKIEIEPLERGKGYEFVDKIVGGVIPKNFIPSVDKGIREAIKKGVLAGFPVVDIRVTLFDGSYHEVDSSDISFQIAARHAFKIAMESDNPVILEPVMHVEIFLPTENTGDVIGEITAKRGRPLGMESVGKGYDKILAEIPLAEMLDFSPRLSSISSGKAYFTMKFSHYSEVTPDIQNKIIEERKREEESEK